MNRYWKTGKKIVCIGRNYAEHAKELGNPLPKSPMFFLKPTTSYLHCPSADDGAKKGQAGQGAQQESVAYPAGGDLHYEVELGVVVGKRMTSVAADKAMNHVAGYFTAVDLTLRDEQQRAKERGLPWSACKGRDGFCPVGDFVPSSEVGNPANLELWLTVNGETRQQGKCSDMVFDVPTLLAHVSQVMTLEPGDAVLTGTPAGVGPIRKGDVVRAGITSVPAAGLEFGLVESA